MSRENHSVLFEGRDVNIRQIFIFGVCLFVFIAVVSALMIPLCLYLWDASDPHVKSAPRETPSVILEVTPHQDLKKMQTSFQEAHADEKIAKAIDESLKEGFPVRES